MNYKILRNIAVDKIKKLFDMRIVAVLTTTATRFQSGYFRVERKRRLKRKKCRIKIHVRK